MTPLRADNPRPEDEGSPISLTLIVKNDGSYSEGLFEIDSTMIIIFLVIIILIIVHIAIAYKILKRK